MQELQNLADQTVLGDGLRDGTALFRLVAKAFDFHAESVKEKYDREVILKAVLKRAAEVDPDNIVTAGLYLIRLAKPTAEEMKAARVTTQSLDKKKEDRQIIAVYKYIGKVMAVRNARKHEVRILEALQGVLNSFLYNEKNDHERRALARDIHPLKRVSPLAAMPTNIAENVEFPELPSVDSGNAVPVSVRQQKLESISPGDAQKALAVSSRLRQDYLVAYKVAQSLPRMDIVNKILKIANIKLKNDALPSLLPIRGSAGAGKTVIAGQVYDALIDARNAVVVIPCGLLRESSSNVDELDFQFGRLLCVDVGLVSVIQSIVEDESRPVVVLFDTIDLQLGPGTWGPIVDLFERLLDAGANVIFTCRHREYAVFLAPDHHLAPVKSFVREPFDIPGLSNGEIIEITKSYLAYRGINPTVGVDRFAEAIVERAARREQLQEVISNPLLLTMVCDTFADEGVVPPDLTRTRLWIAYYEKKIFGTRKHLANTSVARRKLNQWMDIARKIWELSDEHIALSVPLVDLPDDLDSLAAFEDLCSEGVLILDKSIGSRVAFNHQEMAEFSMGVYLRDRAQPELTQLLVSLKREPAVRWDRWRIIQHVIAIADAAEAKQLFDQLDLSQEPAFYAAAYGLVENFRPGLVRGLTKRRKFRRILLDALLLMPDDGLAEALDILARVVCARDHKSAHNATIKAGTLIIRDPDKHHTELVKLLQAVYKQQFSGMPALEADQLLGNLLRHVIDRQVNLSASVLAATRRLVPRATPMGVRFIIRVHMVSGVPLSERRQLLRNVLSHKAANNIGQEALALISSVTEWTVRPQTDGVDKNDLAECDPLVFLNDGGSNSNRLRAHAVARAANEQDELRKTLVTSFMENDDPNIVERLLICLQQAVKEGGSRWVAILIQDQDVPSTSAGLGRVSGLLKTLTVADSELRYKLAGWFSLHVSAESSWTVDAYLKLVYDNPERLELAISYLLALTRQEQERALGNLANGPDPVRWQTVEAILTRLAAPPDEANDAMNFLRARLAGRAVSVNEKARTVLLDLAGDPSRKVSLQAFKYLRQAAEARQGWLLPKLLARFSGQSHTHARLGALKVLARLTRDRPNEAGETIATWLIVAGTRRATTGLEGAEEIATLLAISHSYLRDGVGREPAVLTTIERLVDDVLDAIPNDPLVGREFMALIKTTFMHPNEQLKRRASAWCLDALDRLELPESSDGVSFAEETLGRLIKEGYLDLGNLVTRAQNWPTNILLVVVKLILRYDRRETKSPFLTEILEWPISDEVRKFIWDHRLNPQ
ncbi:MAG: hypothetical protein ACRESJ_27060 [Pseudomonas sp.]|uniref:hypothetical protein n=1 Tax=Pseudomonas sp. TaxID=306 RepID=UPI003D6EC4F7